VLIKALFVVLVLSALAVIGVLIAGYFRVRKHMAKPADQTTVFRKRPPE
jgi:uncharacterized protein YneF (UPF0154 family)